MQQLNEILSLYTSIYCRKQLVYFPPSGDWHFFYILFKIPPNQVFFTCYRIVKGKYDKKTDKGDTSHFQALLPPFQERWVPGILPEWRWLFIWEDGSAVWMLMTAFLRMCTKFGKKPCHINTGF
jgi:AGCS family alanine or glycine:cation symporter